MMKFEGVAKVGDVIRAYDFKQMFGRSDAYVEGIVENANCTEPGYKCYKITCVADFWDGKFRKGVRSSRIAKVVFVPMEVSFMEYDARIINLSK
jgi:hypothetical protein